MPTSVACRPPRYMVPAVRALLFGFGALALGCEPEMGSDASIGEAAVAASDASGTSLEAGGGPLDAEVLDATAAGSIDGGRTGDATGASDTIDGAPLDDASSVVATLDGAVLDGTTLDVDARDADSPDADGPDGGSALDARSPDDASNIDPGVGGDAGPGDAGQSAHTRSGETVWKVRQGRGSDLCPHQSIALWKEENVTLYDPSAAGFQCHLSSCRLSAADLNGGEATFLLRMDNFYFFLIFRARVLLDYSTQSFRDNLLRVGLFSWDSPTKTKIGAGIVGLSSLQPAIEIVSYRSPLLHVRMRGESLGTTNTFNEPSTLPYFCVIQGPTGTGPSLCTTSECAYGTDDPKSASSLTLDLTLPIEPPSP